MKNLKRASWTMGLGLAMLVLALPAAAYVGSDTCGGCHPGLHAQWVDSGHPYKLTELFGAAPVDDFPAFSYYPNDAVDPPDGYTWDDVTFTIGGYGWKMRWIDDQGYIVTSGAAEALVQYNFETQTWATYHTGDEPGTKPYNCGGCHTTGWVADEDWADDNDLSDNQNGLPGMHGTFFAGGVHCEQCHGEGDDHVNDPYGVEMMVDDSSEFCGQCHTRDAENHIAASGGFIRHHEQFDEWLHSPHVNGPGCNTCHDPHSSVKFDDVAQGTGTLTTCAECHPDEAEHSEHNGFPECTDCHMPMASKSAVAFQPYQGDIMTHIFAINIAPVGRTDGMFTEDGGFVQEDAEGQSKVTLDFACYGCHQDESGAGGTFSMKTLVELSDMATNIHGTSTGIDDQPGELVEDQVPASTVLLGAYPNPFNPNTRIAFEVDREQRLSIEVYDMAGRLVRQLADQVFTPGMHSADWRGVDQRGQNVPSGTYLATLRGENIVASQKMMLVR